MMAPLQVVITKVIDDAVADLHCREDSDFTWYNRNAHTVPHKFTAR